MIAFGSIMSIVTFHYFQFLASTSPDTIEDHEILVLIPEISDVECVIGFIHVLEIAFEHVKPLLIWKM